MSNKLQEKLMDFLEAAKETGCSGCCKKNEKILLSILDYMRKIYDLLKEKDQKPQGVPRKRFKDAASEFEQPRKKSRTEDDDDDDDNEDDPFRDELVTAWDCTPELTDATVVQVISDDQDKYEGIEVLDELLAQPTELEDIIEEKVNGPPEIELQFPLNTVAEVEMLEAKLGQQNSPYKGKILQLLLGTHVDTKGHKFAIRALFRSCFEYSVMAQYCWLGNEKKRPLRQLKNTIKFFKAVVSSWYPDWPEQDFIICLRHFLKNCPSRTSIKHWQRRDY